jgi:hypothetical protein
VRTNGKTNFYQGERMIVKDLIQRLQEWDPNAEVRIGRYSGAVDWSIKGISVYLLSPSDDQYCVYLGCENDHFQADIELRTLSLLEKN